MLKKNFAVIGLGKFGTSIALTLEKLGQQVMAFDKDPQVLERVKEYVTSAKILDASNKEALRDSGVTSCDTVIVSIGEAADASFLTVLNLKELGISSVIAKAHTPEQGVILEKIGATRVIYPEKESAIRLANQLTSSDILEFLEISEEYQVAELPTPETFDGKSLEDLALPKEFNIIILAIKRNDKVIGIPQAKEVIKRDDVIVAVGQTKDMQRFLKKHNLTKKK
ncbi:TrkA family potassium uptake protein [Candidatus Woesearchaeota archaeon]|nr:TrkA family potassium uptake protein [Candidatus Woesearchaeota archaeon]